MRSTPKLCFLAFGDLALNGLKHSAQGRVIETSNKEQNMKDKRGLYYYPFLQNKHIHMYVREKDGVIWFRLWNADEPRLWDEHGWVPAEAVKRAANIYQGKKFDPGQAYDLQMALALIEEER